MKSWLKLLTFNQRFYLLVDDVDRLQLREK